MKRSTSVTVAEPLNGEIPTNRSITDNLEQLLEVLPLDVREAIEIEGDSDELLEIVLDLGQKPEARFLGHTAFLSVRQVTWEDLEYVTSRVGEFGKDNRAGIERTLHRISAIRNRRSRIVGLTCRIGRAVYGTLDLIHDVVETGKSILFLGRPGVGKTTMCREAARILSEEFTKRVIVVDTSNEIAGDGDIPHLGIGRARRMQVPSPELQHDVMIEAVENHMPEVIVVDEIGTQAETLAARTIAERGVQLIATAHGNTLERLLMNPTLVDLVGGIQAVTLSDEEAKRRDTQKTVLERKAPPTFEVLVEIMEIGRVAIHHDVATTVDRILRGMPPQPEIRSRNAEGEIEVLPAFPAEEVEEEPKVQRSGRPLRKEQSGPLKIFPYGVSRKRLERAIWEMRLPAYVPKDYREAEAVVSLKAHYRHPSGKLREALQDDVPVFLVRSNTYSQLATALQEIFQIKRNSEETEALREAREGIQQVLQGEEVVELSPRSSYIRRLQHQTIEEHHLRSESLGVEPLRRVKIFRG
ncbi:MAG: AAA family ATPase [Candidatus Tectomicrobia bacterium]|uniref:AAA family ATPase n=1 Tax=Tectimicrobiota bacterium TaxID=2528274 RepID=A0A932FZQ5_UNCTE|nr:AAA family ATPase [Candidatus Tectomicrobia bacterium]